MSDEKADLDQLLSSPGWLRFLEHARQQWNVRLPDRLMTAADLPNADIEVKKIRYATLEINDLLTWPKHRLAQLSKPEIVTSQSRGGYETTAPR